MNIYLIIGTQVQLDSQQSTISCMTWPHKTKDNSECLLVGRKDGSVAIINLYDSNNCAVQELINCSRTDGWYHLNS